MVPAKAKEHARRLAESQAYHEINEAQRAVDNATSHMERIDAMSKMEDLYYRHVPGIGYLIIRPSREGWSPLWVDGFKDLQPKTHEWEKGGTPLKNQFLRKDMKLRATCARCRTQWYESDDGDRAFIDKDNTPLGPSFEPCTPS